MITSLFKSKMELAIIAWLVILLVNACVDHEKDNPDEHLEDSQKRIPIINYAVAKTYPHDTNSFTEGFLVHDGKLYESTGSPEDMPRTRSLFGPVDTSTGRIDKKVEVDRGIFGEGICFLGDKAYQLTYQYGEGFVYDANNFKKLGSFKIPVKEGWGMTTDGTYLIITDGTNIISYLNNSDFNVVKRIAVTDENGPLMKINELEYINGFIYSNVYGTSTIVKIDIASGKVVARIELGSLVREAKARYDGSMELNGIAYDSVRKRIFVTGKMWPIIYEIQFQH